MGAKYLFEVDINDLEPNFREKVEENPNCTFFCPNCGSYYIFGDGIDDFGNFVYMCDDCGYVMSSNEIICE